MKRIPSILLLASFLGIAVFGFVGMRGHDENHRGGCIASLVQKAPCEANYDRVALAFFHTNVFKNFSRSIMNEIGILALFIVIAVLSIFGVWRWQKRDPFVSPDSFRKFRRQLEALSTSWKRDFQPWLSFHQHSPSLG